jgi:hypothetical protein
VGHLSVSAARAIRFVRACTVRYERGPVQVQSLNTEAAGLGQTPYPAVIGVQEMLAQIVPQRMQHPPRGGGLPVVPLELVARMTAVDPVLAGV